MGSGLSFTRFKQFADVIGNIDQVVEGGLESNGFEVLEVILGELEIGEDGFEKGFGLFLFCGGGFIGIDRFARMVFGFLSVAQEAGLAHETGHGFAIHDARDKIDDERELFHGELLFALAEEQRCFLELRERGSLVGHGLGVLHPKGDGGIRLIRKTRGDEILEAGVGIVGIAMADGLFGSEAFAPDQEGVGKVLSSAFAFAFEVVANVFFMLIESGSGFFTDALQGYWRWRWLRVVVVVLRHWLAGWKR